MRKYFALSFSILFLLVCLAGCTGPEGPMGPTGATGLTGPPGPGDQIVYSFDLVPSFNLGNFACECPDIDLDYDSELCSTVCVYLSYDGFEYISVPYEYTETDDSTTLIYYTIKEDILNLKYINSGTTVPGEFTLFVTVVNP